MAVRQIAAAGAARRASHGGCLQASFEDGEYSATDLDSPPLLTINAPIGLNLRDNPAKIINRSVVQNNVEETIGLEVSPENNLTLVGGEINLEGGNLTAPGGRIELGGLSQAGTVTFNGDGSLGFPEDVAKADVTLSNAAVVNVTGTGEGSVVINARNLRLEGESGSSSIGAGITSDSTDSNAQAGDITINATDNVTVDESFIINQVDPEALGDTGNVTITTGSLSLTNGGLVGTSIEGRGNAGSVKITATDNIGIDGENPNFISGVGSLVNVGGVGNGGDVTITTGNLTLTNGGQVTASIFGTGNAGSVKVTATDNIVIDGESSPSFPGYIAIDDESLLSFPSGVGNTVYVEAVGNAGDVTITTDTLSLTNGGRADANTFGTGNAGDLTVNASSLITISGATENNRSGLFVDALVSSGNGGNVNVSTNQLTINDGGTIEASNFDSLGELNSGIGEPGNINIEANTLSLSNNASIDAATQSETGDGANINIQIADNLSLKNSSSISAQAFEEADGGDLSIDAEYIVAFPNGDNDIIASAEQGNGGNIAIDAESIFGIEERPLSQTTNDINASSFVSGLDGTVSITTLDINPIQGATELPSNLVVPQQTTEQACQSNREAEAKNGLDITGKGGVPPAPELPLNSHNTIIEGEYTDSISATPQPIETSKGKIQPARGIEVTPEGVIRLTAYRTDNAGDRLPEIKQNCG